MAKAGRRAWEFLLDYTSRGAPFIQRWSMFFANRLRPKNRYSRDSLMSLGLPDCGKEVAEICASR